MIRSEFSANLSLSAGRSAAPAGVVTIRDASPVAVAFRDSRDPIRAHSEFYRARQIVKDARRADAARQRQNANTLRDIAAGAVNALRLSSYAAGAGALAMLAAFLAGVPA